MSSGRYLIAIFLFCLGLNVPALAMTCKEVFQDQPAGTTTVRDALELISQFSSAVELTRSDSGGLIGDATVKKLTLLRPEERHFLQSELSSKEHRFNQQDLVVALKLTLMDGATWMSLITQTKSQGLNEHAPLSVGALAFILRNMPQSLKDQLLPEALDGYQGFSKGGNGDRLNKFLGRSRFSPKRAMDLIISNLAWSEYMQKNLGQDPIRNQRAFAMFLASITGPLKSSNVGHYGLDSVRTVAYELQGYLNALPTPSQDAAIYLVGSFPNGRAKLATSDLDLKIKGIGFSRLFLHRHSLNERIQELLKQELGEDTAIDLGIMADHPFFDSSLEYAGIASLVGLKITTDQIHLVVFPAENLLQPIRFPLPNIVPVSEFPLW